MIASSAHKSLITASAGALRTRCLSRAASVGFTCSRLPARTIIRIPAAAPDGVSSESSKGGDGADSSSFASSLRRGFAPLNKPSHSSNGNSSGASSSSTRSSSSPAPSPEGFGSNAVILGKDLSEESWKALDAKVNKYPGLRTFTAIGAGGDAFASAMVTAVSSVVGTVHEENVVQRPSSGGRYLSVKVSVWVQSVEQVVQVYSYMKGDARVKWLI